MCQQDLIWLPRLLFALCCSRCLLSRHHLNRLYLLFSVFVVVVVVVVVVIVVIFIFSFASLTRRLGRHFFSRVITISSLVPSHFFLALFGVCVESFLTLVFLSWPSSPLTLTSTKTPVVTSRPTGDPFAESDKNKLRCDKTCSRRTQTRIESELLF